MGAWIVCHLEKRERRDKKSGESRSMVLVHDDEENVPNMDITGRFGQRKEKRQDVVHGTIFTDMVVTNKVKNDGASNGVVAKDNDDVKSGRASLCFISKKRNTKNMPNLFSAHEEESSMCTSVEASICGNGKKKRTGKSGIHSLSNKTCDTFENDAAKSAQERKETVRIFLHIFEPLFLIYLMDIFLTSFFFSPTPPYPPLLSTTLPNPIAVNSDTLFVNG